MKQANTRPDKVIKPTYKNIPYIKGWVLSNFPFIEADFDAITSYELWCKVVMYVNELISNMKITQDTINELLDSFEDLYDYVNTYLVDVDTLKEQVRVINEVLVDYKELIDKNTEDITRLDSKIDSEIRELSNTLTELINTNYNILKNYVDANDAILDEKITNIQIGAIQVYNPTNGLLQPLQEVLNDLYESGNKDAITASEYDALEITATYYDSLDLTARDYDTSAKTILT